MPKASLFSSSRAQATAVAGVMAVLLVAALSVAYGMSGSLGVGGAGVGPTSARRLNFKGVSLKLPGAWEAIKGDRLPNGMTQVAVFGNPQDPQVRLMVAKVHADPPQPPQAMLQATLEQLVHGPSREVAQPLVHLQPGRAWGKYVAVSKASKGGIRHHFLYVVTHNGQDYWVVYLTDRTAADRSLAQALRGNNQTFERIVHSLSFEPDAGKGAS